jgi:hypothetical protein
MKNNASRNKSRKPAEYPAYLKALHEAFKPLSRLVSTQYVSRFAAMAAQAVAHMTDQWKGEGFPTEEDSIRFQGGEIELLCMFLRREERDAVFSLVQAMLEGKKDAQYLVKLIKAPAFGAV